MSVEIRPLVAAEKPRWAELWRAYLAFYETERPEAVYDATFAAFFTNDAYAPRALVAEIDGQIVGLVHYIFHAHCWTPAGVCYLQDLFTAPAARGKGVGGALIHAVYAAADTRGVPDVYWMTQSFNTTARSLYDRIGEVTPFIKYRRVT